MAADAATIPEEVSSLWKSLDPAIRAALIASESSNNGDAESSDKTSKAGQQGRRALTSDGPRMDDTSSKFIGGSCFTKREANPGWIKVRSDVYDAVKGRRDEELAAKVPVEIEVTLPDGKTLVEDKQGVKYQSWRTTPFDVAATISRGLADSSYVARVTYKSYVSDYDPAEDGVGGEPFSDAAVETLTDSMEDMEVDGDVEDKTSLPPVLWDLTRPLVGSVSKIEFLKFQDDDDARTTFWHSSAHVLGEALERLYGGRLTIGPPLAGGFYYDAFMGDGSSDGAFNEDDYKTIEAEVSKIVKQKQKFERLVVTKEEALEMFSGNPFKEQIITTKVADGSRTTVYRNGDLVDLCRGPHVTNTGRIKAFAATRHSATNWLGDTENDSLQRMYGISFPDKKMLKVWKENQEKAKERDHRRIANKQNLIMFHELSAGSAFWLPHGARIYNKLINFIKEHYWKRGYHEIITPNVYNLDLWHQSGHAMHYKDAMFCFDVEGKEWAMKPMNCPGHCLVFAGKIRSYRDLPLRFADFGVLHRNELSGALSGLTRVRRFQQDDAHIFCREDQIESEVIGSLEFMKSVYATFGMTYKLELSTRPEKGLGEIELWDRAESALERAMDEFAGKGGWKVNPGDGAFYGPKIDIKVMDAMDRVHQCATIQLDFQLPIRFDLQYNTGSKEKGNEFARPVMVHRAMLGSVERMFAVLCEHYGGKWPFWLSPRQVMIIPVHKDWNDYCQEVRDKLHNEGFYADVDLTKAKFPKKVRTAQIDQYNFQLVVGAEEVKNGTVNIRTRENKVEGEKKVDDLIAFLKELRAEHK